MNNMEGDSLDIVLERQKMRAKLPKWAQEELATLERNLSDARSRFTKIGAVSGPVVVEPFYPTPIHFPEGTQVRFKVGERYDHYIDIQISKGRPNTIQIRAGESVSIIPDASNSLYVEIRDRSKSAW